MQQVAQILPRTVRQKAFRMDESARDATLPDSLVDEEPMPRVTVPVDEETLRYLVEHATDLGLPPSTSQASILAQIIRLGASELRRRSRDRMRDRLYSEWADDGERQEVVARHVEAARETGMY